MKQTGYLVITFQPIFFLSKYFIKILLIAGWINLCFLNDWKYFLKCDGQYCTSDMKFTFNTLKKKKKIVKLTEIKTVSLNDSVNSYFHRHM